MEKQPYEVMRPWHGISAGQIVHLSEPVSPALRANVRKVSQEHLAVAVPQKTISDTARPATVADGPQPGQGDGKEPVTQPDTASGKKPAWQGKKA